MRKPPATGPIPTSELLAVLRRAVPSLVRSAPLIVSLMALMVVLQGLLPAATVFLSKWTVDGITAVAGGGEANLTLLAVAWAGTALIGQLTAVGRAVLQGYATDHFTVQTVTQLMRKMQALPGLDVVEDPRFHDDVETLQTGARFRPLNLTATLLGLLQAVVGVVGVAGALLTVGWWVPLVVVVGMIPLARTQIRLREMGWSLAIQRTQEARELAYDQRVALRHEYAKEVRLYDLMPYLTGRYVDGALAYQRVMRGMRNRQVLGLLPAQVLALAVTAGLFAYAVAQAGQGQLTAGTVVLVIGALAGVRDSLGSVTEYLGMGTEHLRWFQKYYAFLDAKPGVAAPAQPRPLPTRLDLRLDDVSFGYRDLPPVLEHVSLHIPEGQVVAIVGENGAGKTTLVKLLLRFYDPTSGRVLLGAPGEEVDLRGVNLTAWRSQVAAVFQDFARFEWTVRDNVLLGRPEDGEKLALTADASGLKSILPRLPDGLNTRIGQAFGGVDLSGGQWQKLATARALYRDARVLILDEPTAALDPRSESEVFAAFAALARGRTTLLITHRLGSVLMADRILVMKAGRLIEDGTHAELLARGGEYAELWRLQAGQYTGEDAVRGEQDVVGTN
ncbi:ATP-binding cassette subfamily B protein/ATP-binding cassette subfamily C protein [Deinococcus sp. HSC-46F16]|uniref:ABC transporter ATP-binding protein n=1 Tax=Deinococcus sp. HSC-46F16 TaxID=2910968 RepID=UPI00209D76C2|nr:ATP-binding cassette subfamily B protein/ATP-binding cassette subfamily C protein [Deinococcus sp. HSC-46F16]